MGGDLYVIFHHLNAQHVSSLFGQWSFCRISYIKYNIALWVFAEETLPHCSAGRFMLRHKMEPVSLAHFISQHMCERICGIPSCTIFGETQLKRKFETDLSLNQKRFYGYRIQHISSIV